MSTFKSLLQRWWRPLLFVAWIWALTGLLKNERYTAFLRPEFGYVLGVGVFTLLGFLMTGMAEARPRRFGIPQALHALILLLPLAYLWNAQGASLDAYAFQNRSLGLPSVEMPGNKPRTGPSVIPSDPGQAAKTPKTAPTPRSPQRVQPPPVARTPIEKQTLGQAEENIPQAESRKPAEPAKTVTITDLYYAPRTYEGKQVKLIGMLHKNDAQVKKDFGKDLLVVFRFVINCCAADATPAAVLVDGEEFPDLPESAWVEVEGTFTLHEKNGRRVPILEKSSIKKIDAPKQQYLF